MVSIDSAPSVAGSVLARKLAISLPSTIVAIMKSLAAFAWLVAATTLSAEPIIREPGAIYLADFDAPPMRLKVLDPAPAYFDFKGTRYVGTLRFPQTVEVQAVSDQAYRVRGNAQQGQVLGWVGPGYLEEIPEETLTSLHEAEERRISVAALIAANDVAIGMTTDEVTESLGQPQKRSRRTTGDQLFETWEYVEYELIPQRTNVIGPRGVVTVTTTYIKTPIGRLTVTFTGGIVDSLEQSEGTILKGDTTTIIAPPIFVY